MRHVAPACVLAVHRFPAESNSEWLASRCCVYALQGFGMRRNRQDDCVGRIHNAIVKMSARSQLVARRKTPARKAGVMTMGTVR
eukprot:COSAG03_NODE_574_length_6896_cov_8.214948_6_plen_84_part_00